MVFSKKQSFTAGEWINLAATWNDREAAIFLNGRESSRSPLDEGLPDKALPEYFQVGAIESWINAGPCGVISDFMLFDIALRESDLMNMLS